MSINSLLRWFLTLLIIVIACIFCYIRYNAYFRNPWTRDGMVQAPPACPGRSRPCMSATINL